MSNRLSSLSASLSLSNIIDDKSNDFKIHTSPTEQRHSTTLDTKVDSSNDSNASLFPNSRSVSRLKMQSYFDKENLRQKPKSPTQKHKESRSALSPLHQISSNVQAKHQSLTSVKTSSTGKTTRTGNNESRKSYVSYNSNESTKSLYRKSLETFGIKKSDHIERDDHIEAKNIVNTTNNVQKFETVDELPMDEAPVTNSTSPQESGFRKLTKTITKSSSFISLRNSLSMKSISSHLELENTDHNDRRKSVMSMRKMSLENIRSFLKPAKNNNDNLDYKNNISLPVMQQQTKEKIRHKLRHSSSIVSISSFASDTDHAKLKSIDLNQIHQSLLLKLCNQSRIVSFTSYLNKFQSSSTMKHLTRLHKSKNSFIFAEFSTTDDFSDTPLKPSGVWKIIPIHMDTLAGTIKELTLTMIMNNQSGFVKINSAKVVKGPCPRSIMDLMEEDQPKNQVYLIMRLNYGGVTLKDYKLKSWKDASIIFAQVLNAMCEGENENYEHRDLNMENILIDETELPDKSTSINVTIIDHALGCSVVNGQSIHTNLYHSDFFRGSGEYSHTIYRLMRRVVSNRTVDITDSFSTMSVNNLTRTETQGTDFNPSEWAKSYPVFNLLWVHYLLHILIFEKGLKPIKMNPILKKKGWLASGGEVGEETAIYEKLLQGYRMVQPSIILGSKKNKYLKEVQNVREFREWYTE